jgi:hypothetical protein
MEKGSYKSKLERVQRLINIKIFVPALPRDLPHQKAQIIAAVKNIDAPMLARVWQELEYRIDVCRVTCSAKVEHL